MISHRPAAVVCDMDGLLVDSERMEGRVWRAAAAEHGIELSDERFRTFVGHSADQCDRMLLDYYGAEFDVPAFRATCHRRMRTLVEAEGVPLRAGAREWLRFVTGQGGERKFFQPGRFAMSKGVYRLGSAMLLFAALSLTAYWLISDLMPQMISLPLTTIHS